MNAILFALVAFIAFAPPAKAQETGRILITDFNKGEPVGLFSVSVSNPLDSSQWIKMNWVDEDALGKPRGRSIRLDYDVDSREPAKVFFWITLKEMNLSDSDTLHLYLKGSKGFRGHVTVWFAGLTYHSSPYVVGRIESRWKEFRIPLKRFRLRNWSSIREFMIVIDDTYAVPKEGTIFVDEIFVSSQLKNPSRKRKGS